MATGPVFFFSGRDSRIRHEFERFARTDSGRAGHALRIVCRKSRHGRHLGIDRAWPDRPCANRIGQPRSGGSRNAKRTSLTSRFPVVKSIRSALHLARRRRAAPESGANSALSTFTATSRFRTRSRAEYTTPCPPPAISSPNSYRSFATLDIATYSRNRGPSRGGTSCLLGETRVSVARVADGVYTSSTNFGAAYPRTPEDRLRFSCLIPPHCLP